MRAWREYGPIILLLLCVSLAGEAWAGEPEDNVCPRPAAGSVVGQPPELHSQNGRLEVTLRFQIAEDTRGLLRFCYLTKDGLQAPTLRVKPGDELIIHFRNELPGPAAAQPAHGMEHASGSCSDAPMSMAGTNLHFHGLSVPPKCHQDDVMHTLIGPGKAFDYRVKVPANATPGVYWYHPHPHPFGETQVQGGASGALIVEGMAAVYPEISGLPERVLVLRDQKLGMGVNRSSPDLPAWDISLNYVPVLYPTYEPAVLETTPHQQEFWRVLNASADTIFDLQMIVNNAPRSLRVLAIDGVPLENKARSDQSVSRTDVLLLPGSRVEFVVETPRPGDRAEFITRAWDTGPEGENQPQRTIAKIVSVDKQSAPRHGISKAARGPRRADPYAALKTATPIAQRKLYFSEIQHDPTFGGTSYYLTVNGQTPARFKMEGAPNIVARQGTIEDWTIENQSREEHVFHIHQIHFRVIEIDGKPVNDPAVRDTVDLPYWKGEGPYPSVKLRMDFRDPSIAGTLMYHCHILQHSTSGMMGSIQIVNGN